MPKFIYSLTLLLCLISIESFAVMDCKEAEAENVADCLNDYFIEYINIEADELTYNPAWIFTDNFADLELQYGLPTPKDLLAAFDLQVLQRANAAFNSEVECFDWSKNSTAYDRQVSFVQYNVESMAKFLAYFHARTFGNYEGFLLGIKKVKVCSKAANNDRSLEFRNGVLHLGVDMDEALAFDYSDIDPTQPLWADFKESWDAGVPILEVDPKWWHEYGLGRFLLSRQHGAEAIIRQKLSKFWFAVNPQGEIMVKWRGVVMNQIIKPLLKLREMDEVELPEGFIPAAAEAITPTAGKIRDLMLVALQSREFPGTEAERQQQKDWVETLASRSEEQIRELFYEWGSGLSSGSLVSKFLLASFSERTEEDDMMNGNGLTFLASEQKSLIVNVRNHHFVSAFVRVTKPFNDLIRSSYENKHLANINDYQAENGELPEVELEYTRTPSQGTRLIFRCSNSRNCLQGVFFDLQRQISSINVDTNDIIAAGISIHPPSPSQLRTIILYQLLSEKTSTPI